MQDGMTPVKKDTKPLREVKEKEEPAQETQGGETGWAVSAKR